jgi:uncharacterized protein YegL
MKRNSGLIAGLIIFGIVVFIIVNINLDDKKSDNTVSSTDDTAYEEAYGDSGEIDEGWPPGIGELETDLAENKLLKNYYLILDGSGSMSGQKMKTAKEALGKFINIVPAEANIGLAVFDEMGLSERAWLGAPREKLLQEIKRVSASGYTPLMSSLNLAYERINTQAARQLGYGEYNIVVVTDGEASDGEEPDYIVDEILMKSPVVIHTIGFQIGEYHSLNQPGRILYKSANNFEELSEGLEEVLAEMEDFSVSDFQEF